MWTRQELKETAKERFKANYWKSVLIGLILSWTTGSNSISNGRNATKDKRVTQIFQDMNVSALLVVGGLVLGLLALVLIANTLLKILVYNPVEIGCCRCLIECKDGSPELGRLGWGFKNGYGSNVMTMFCRDIFIFLWSLLLIVPGIIKAYEYRMVPYILAENPEMERKEVLEKSKQMMMGNKWDTFVLDLSFIGWHLLSIITLGILSLFYVTPYVCHTNAQLYNVLKAENADGKIVDIN